MYRWWAIWAWFFCLLYSCYLINNYWMRSRKIWGIIKAEADSTNRRLNNSSYSARTEFNNCFIIFWKYFKLSLNACFVSKKTQATNNGTAWNCSEALISRSVKSHINYSVTSYLVSIYDERSHNVVYIYLCSTPNLGNYQADMTISPTAVNQSKLLKYFQ